MPILVLRTNISFRRPACLIRVGVGRARDEYQARVNYLNR